MNPYKITIFSFLIAGAFLLTEPAAQAQGNSQGHGNKGKNKEYKQTGKSHAAGVVKGNVK
jgi:hypothetical protein